MHHAYTEDQVAEPRAKADRQLSPSERGNEGLLAEICWIVGGSIFTAHGCDPAQPLWGCRFLRPVTQGSSWLATLGWRAEPGWGSPARDGRPAGAASAFEAGGAGKQNLMNCRAPYSSAPKGLCPKAQGCRDAATLGADGSKPLQPQRGCGY